MLPTNKREPITLIVGDLLALVFSLYFALFLRNGELPSLEVLEKHFPPFSFVFIITLLVFFIAGLYDKQRIIVKRRLPESLFNAEIVNTIIAIFFFYFIPYFGVTPKVLLFIYIFLSFIFVFSWRVFSSTKDTTKNPDNALLIATSEEADELEKEINNNNRYGFKITKRISADKVSDLSEKNIIDFVHAGNVKLIIADTSHKDIAPILPVCYKLFFKKIAFVDFHILYENIFDRAPISLLNESWVLNNIRSGGEEIYDMLKRVMDIVVSLPLFVFSLLFYPFVFIGNLFEGNRSLFSFQERVGKFDTTIKLIKFRTMLFDDNGEWSSKGLENKVTVFGKFLRKTRIDELPQLWNVLKGDISLIGPRPEFPKAVKEYEQAIPYYSIRHIITPGLSGWAQIYHEEHPHHGIDLKETKRKLSYDIYYIKHRSVLLDIIIALKTIRTLLSRQGK